MEGGEVLIEVSQSEQGFDSIKIDGVAKYIFSGIIPLEN